MNLPRRVREILIVSGLLVLPALMLRASVKAPENLNFLDRAVLRLTSPLQAGLMAAVRGVGDALSHYVLLVRVKEQNAALQAENLELRRQVRALQLATERSERLERLLSMRSDILAETVAARVVGVETSPTFRVLRVRIDRGAAEVRPGMPVLAAAGVVGRVARTYGPYSDVLLAVDARSSVDVVLPRIGSRGVLKGSASEDLYRCRIDYLLRQDEVKVGDQVVTSGLLSIFPADIPVGKVVAIRKQAFGLYQEVEVEPAVDFNKLREVLVVLAPPPPPDPDAGKRPAEGVRGLAVPR